MTEYLGGASVGEQDKPRWGIHELDLKYDVRVSRQTDALDDTKRHFMTSVALECGHVTVTVWGPPRPGEAESKADTPTLMAGARGALTALRRASHKIR